jgi:hypothetical protein
LGHEQDNSSIARPKEKRGTRIITAPAVSIDRCIAYTDALRGFEDLRVIDKGRRESATEPEDLSRFFVERANAGDVEGLVALYEREAVLALALATGEVARGMEACKRLYAVGVCSSARPQDVTLGWSSVVGASGEKPNR